MSLSSNFPTIKPSLNLDFANVGRLDPRVTFTRASTATYYDGVTTAKAEENLLLQSQALTTSPWTVTSLNAVGSKTAPDGTATAIEITATATNGRTRQTVTVVSGQTYTHSMFVRRVTGSGNVTLAILDSGGTALFSTVMSLTSDWQRFTVSGAPAVTSIQAGIIIATSTDAVEVWGAQLEQRSSVTAYTATTTQPITNYIPVLLTAQNDVPRFDHNPTTGAALGLLIEEQRTNLLLQSQDFATTWVATRASISSNATVAPDGTTTADKFIEDTTASNTHEINQTGITVVSGTTYAFSVYLKAAERTKARLVYLAGGAGVYADADLSSGTIGAATSFSGGTAASSSIQFVGNGWYRCTVVGSQSASTSGSCRVELLDASGNRTYTGDGYSGLFIWGAQLEAGSFATSYIPTTTTALTRSADAASMTGTAFSDFYNQAEGTIYSEHSGPNALNKRIYAISNGTGDNTIEGIHASGSGIGINFFIRTNATNQFTIPSAATYQDKFWKLAGAYATNNAAASRDGGAVSTSATAILPVVDQLRIGSSGGGSSTLSGHIRKIAYYPVRLSNAQLQALTG